MYEGTVLNLEFEDTTWMDNINKVIVNDKECKKSTINSFSSDTNIWEVGSATGAYGSYKALKLAVPDGKLWTVKVSADGYKDLTVKITKETVNYTDTYKAEVVSNSGETTNKTYTADKPPRKRHEASRIRRGEVEPHHVFRGIGTSGTVQPGNDVSQPCRVLRNPCP